MFLSFETSAAGRAGDYYDYELWMHVISADARRLQYSLPVKWLKGWRERCSLAKGRIHWPWWSEVRRRLWWIFLPWRAEAAEIIWKRKPIELRTRIILLDLFWVSSFRSLHGWYSSISLTIKLGVSSHPQKWSQSHRCRKSLDPVKNHEQSVSSLQKYFPHSWVPDGKRGRAGCKGDLLGTASASTSYSSTPKSTCHYATFLFEAFLKFWSINIQYVNQLSWNFHVIPCYRKQEGNC